MRWYECCIIHLVLYIIIQLSPQRFQLYKLIVGTTFRPFLLGSHNVMVTALGSCEVALRASTPIMCKPRPGSVFRGRTLFPPTPVLIVSWRRFRPLKKSTLALQPSESDFVPVPWILLTRGGVRVPVRGWGAAWQCRGATWPLGAWRVKFDEDRWGPGTVGRNICELGACREFPGSRLAQDRCGCSYYLHVTKPSSPCVKVEHTFMTRCLPTRELYEDASAQLALHTHLAINIFIYKEPFRSPKCGFNKW